MDTKPIWQSKTLYAQIIGAAATVTALFGLDLGLTPETQAALVGGVWAVVNIIIRFRTNKGVTLT